MSKDKRINYFGGALSLTLSALTVKILGVIYKVPLSYILTDVGMGYFNTAYTVYGFFYIICSAGVPKAITCILSEKEETAGRIQADEIYKFALKLFTLVGGIITLIFTLGAPLIVRLIDNPRSLYTLLLIGPSILFVSTGGVARGKLASFGKLSSIAFSQVIEAIMKLVLGLSFAYLGSALKLRLEMVSALAILGITVGSAFSTLYLVICARTQKSLVIERQNHTFDKISTAKAILKIAAPITVGSSVLTLGNMVDVGIIMRLLKQLGYNEITANELYGNYTTLAIPMFNLVISLVAPLTVYLLPKLVKLNVSGSKSELMKETNRVLWITVLFVAPCSCAYYFYSFDLLDIIFRSSQSAIGFELLSALSFGLILLSALNVINTALEALGCFKSTIISLTLGILIKLIIEPILILKTSLGILGIPVSTTLSYFVSIVFSLIVLKSKGVGINLFKTMIYPMLCAYICFYLPYITVYSANGIGGKAFNVIFLCATCMIFYVLLLLLFEIFIQLIGKKVKIHKKSVVERCKCD